MKRKIANLKTSGVTQTSQNGKIAKVPVKPTTDVNYLEKIFADISRDLIFYDFPAYWKDDEIHEKQVGYAEHLTVKRNYKYKTVQTRIRLTRDMNGYIFLGCLTQRFLQAT